MTDNPIPILAYGSGWLAADKPCGISVHNEPGNDLCSKLATTLTDQIDMAQVSRATQYPSKAPIRLHPVHRLDKQTSGVILLAWDKAALSSLASAFMTNRVSKRYLALVHASQTGPAPQGWWQWSLSARAAGRRNLKGSGHRVTCRTEYRLVARSYRYALLDCRLHTGRTHQIRRHAALAGHPVVGDTRYGSSRACRHLETRFGFKRLALHCTGIHIRPPEADRRRWIISDKLPEAIQRLFDVDRKDLSKRG